MKRIINLIAFTFCVCSQSVSAQNALLIPPALTGTTFNLSVQSGTQNFYGATNTPTYGVNGVWQAPTIIVNKGDSITLHVTNNLPVKTTMHWHGLHVSAKNDGGPHQIINAGATWNPSFKVRNNAGTFWYHPHGAGQTDPQVSKGIAGFFIVKDNDEALLNLPRTYGVDDIPLNIQTKAFDALHQIAIASNMDTAVFMNGTLNANLDAPAQVIRFRVLNGSSLRSYNLGLSNGQSFYLIGTDGGLRDSSLAMTRLLLAPGERAEILVNLSGLMLGQTIELKSYASELPKGIYGADSVGTGNDTIPQYYNNPLNGSDFTLLTLNVVSQTVNPITSIPTALIPFNPYNIGSATVHRTIDFDTIRLLPADIPNRAEGPFGMNNKSFDMDSINQVVYVNTTEIWKLVNHTLVAHSFHIHDVQFNIIKKSGLPTPADEKGWKDVVLVMPEDSVEFITKFEDFTDTVTPYMYHCHLLHHEDDGMMGSFIVRDSAFTLSVHSSTLENSIFVFPNPSSDFWQIKRYGQDDISEMELSNVSGQIVFAKKADRTKQIESIDNSLLPKGVYFLQLKGPTLQKRIKLIKQ